MNRETQYWLFLFGFWGHIIISLVVLGVLIYAVRFVRRHLSRAEDYMKDSQETLRLSVNYMELTKTYAALVEKGRKETQAAVVRTSNETQKTVVAKAEEVKQEVRHAGGIPDRDKIDTPPIKD